MEQLHTQLLKDRFALITGGSRGIGRAITLAFAREGAKVIVCGREPDALHEIAKEVEEKGSGVYTFALDATKPEEIDRFFKAVSEKISHLDILVNNIGGVRQFAKFSELTDADWYEVFEHNLMTTVRFTRGVLPWLLKSEHAAVVNIASVAGKQPGNYNPHYGAAKAAVIHLSKYLANQLGPHGIRVNAVCPSTIRGGVWERDVQSKARMDETPISEAEARLEAEVKAKAPLGKIGTPEDVAELAVFLASDRAKFITGTCITVDGGTVRSIF